MRQMFEWSGLQSGLRRLSVLVIALLLAIAALTLPGLVVQPVVIQIASCAPSEPAPSPSPSPSPSPKPKPKPKPKNAVHAVVG